MAGISFPMCGYLRYEKRRLPFKKGRGSTISGGWRGAGAGVSSRRNRCVVRRA